MVFSLHVYKHTMPLDLMGNILSVSSQVIIGAKKDRGVCVFRSI